MDEKKVDTDGRLRSLEIGQITTQEAIVSIRDSLKSFNEALGGIRDSIAAIATIETHHKYTRESISRAFVSIKNIESQIASVSKRVSELEKITPPLVETRGWIILGMLGTMATVFGTVLYLVIRTPSL